MLYFWLYLIPLFFVQEQDKREFSPLKDSRAVIEDCTSAEGWDGRYMWYPGQLAAYLQSQCLEESGRRCVNVGYPGKYYERCGCVYFRKSLDLENDTPMQWSSSGETSIILDGNTYRVDSEGKMILPQGSHLLIIKVSSEVLPCVILNGLSVSESKGWMTSLNMDEWTLPEMAEYYDSPSRPPYMERERTVEILPYEITQPLGLGSGMTLYDFWHLELGTVVIKARGEGLITARVGETPEEALETDVSKYEQHPIPSFEVSGNNECLILPRRALRYLSLECEGAVEVQSVSFQAEMWPVNTLMHFESDDDFLNSLFKMSEATLHSSMHGFYLDGLKRDFLPWAMDAAICGIAGDYLFGDRQVSMNGVSVALMPDDPEIMDIGIPDYPLHALFSLYHIYLRYGDPAILIQYKDRITDLLGFYFDISDKRGFIGGRFHNDHFGFTPGWSTYNGPSSYGVPAYVQIMLYASYRIGAFFARIWGDENLFECYSAHSDKLKRNIIDCFWDNDRKAFINGIMDDLETEDMRISHHAQYWAILAGLFPEDDYDNLFDNILPALPKYYDIVSYEKGYEFIAYSKAGRINQMWDYIVRVFGDWMLQGHTRFPENFSPGAPKQEQNMFYGRPYGLSLCHGANGAPVVICVLNGILGFSYSTSPDYDYVIRPDLLHLNTVEACFPVKEGMVRLNLNADAESSVEVPDNCRCKLVTEHESRIFEGKISFIL